MNGRKLTATTAMAGAFACAAVGIGSAVATADPGRPGPPGPVDIWVPGDPPGHNPVGPPGQVKQAPLVNGVPNPLYGVPPGHWDDPVAFGYPATYLPPNYPEIWQPLPVVWNPDNSTWGVWVNAGVFVPVPL